jgi:DnaJ-class molecular chaperone
MNYYNILGVKETDSIEYITKKYKELAKRYHPDRNPLNTISATEKFKEINVAFTNIKEKHNKFNKPGIDFKLFTEKLINKGEFMNGIFNKAKTIDMGQLFAAMFKNIKKIRFYYDDIFSETSTDDININVNVELKDIYNSEEKLINLVRKRKCIDCFTNDLAFCTVCNNKIYYEQEKVFVINCNEKLIIFAGESNEEKNNKPGDIIIRILPKTHNDFVIFNNYDILYYIFSNKAEDIKHEFVFLDNLSYHFECYYPYSDHYTIENKGLCIPYSDKRGNLIIKIVQKHETNINFKLYLNNIKS